MAGVCDFVFLIDATESMQSCLDALVQNISVFVDGITDPQTIVRDWRGKAVCYRDADTDGDMWFEDNPFVSDVEALKSQLRRIEAMGGGDAPESLLEALHKVITMEAETEPGSQSEPNEHKWRHRSESARVIIVFTDSTYHETMSNSPLTKSVMSDSLRL